MKGFFGHLKTVITHKWAVFYHGIKIGIPLQAFFHDMSKFSPIEFLGGAKNYASVNGKRSPNEIERELYGYSPAWLHHKGRNRHHFEYWTDYNPIDKKIRPVKMPYKYILEMFCDRVAASKVYQGKNYTNSRPYEYFLKGKATRFIHPVTSDTIENLLIMLKEKGEKETFQYIKRNRKALEAKYNLK